MKRKTKNVVYKMVALMMICLLTFPLSSCGKADKRDGKLLIVTTLFPQYDFAKQIAGDKAEVKLLLSPGTEAHSYDPTPSDIVDINESDLFIYTGDYMETWAAKIIKGLEKDVNILDVSDKVEIIKTEDEESHSHSEEEHIYSEENIDDNEENEGHSGHNHIYDPHIWTSLSNAKIMVQNIVDELVKIDSENEDYYRANGEKYLLELTELDNRFKEVVENSDIKTIYFADKFAMYYFVKDYGLDYVSAYDSCSSETEPSAKLVAEMIDEVKENNAPAIYYAELSNHKAADTISKETGAKEYLLHSCHNISKDEYKNGVTYISLMEQNLENLKKGLNFDE